MKTNLPTYFTAVNGSIDCPIDHHTILFQHDLEAITSDLHKSAMFLNYNAVDL